MSATSGAGDAEIRNLVERAFPETTVEIVPEDDDTPTAYRSDDAKTAWKRMHDAAGGREIDILVEMLGETWLRGEERWKAVTFLGYSLQTPEAQASRDAILRTLAQDAAVKQRGNVPNDDIRIQGAALQAVLSSNVTADQKWETLLAAVQVSRSHVSEIAKKLLKFRPSNANAIADAYPILVDAMIRSDRPVDLDATVRLVRALDVRTSAPDLRRLLLAANSNLSARAAAVLADWDDKKSAFDVRRAIDQYSNANDPNVDVLVEALCRLEGPACAEYLGEMFAVCPAGLQEYLLLHSLRENGWGPLHDAVRKIAGSTSDVELKAVAERYLEAVPRTDVDASAFESVARDDSWQPRMDGGESSAPMQASTSAAESAPAASDGSWQPSTGDPAGGSEVRARRLAVEAEALAAIRAQAAEEQRQWQSAFDSAAQEQDVRPAPGMTPEKVISIVTALVAIAAVGVAILLLLSGVDTGGTPPASP